MPSMINPISPVSAPTAPAGAGQGYDAANRGRGVEAAPAGRRATLAKATKLWRSYSKGGIKKKYVLRQRKKSAREMETALLQSAGGAYLVTESRINDARSRERDEARRRVGSLKDVHAGQQPFADSRENSARRVDEHLVRVARKNAAASRRQDTRAASGEAGDAAGFRATLGAAKDNIAGLPIDVVAKAANAPLELVARASGIDGLPAVVIQSLCAKRLQELIRAPLSMMQSLCEQDRDEKKIVSAFGKTVALCAEQNERGVRPGGTLRTGIERAGSLALVNGAIAMTMAWHPGGWGGQAGSASAFWR